MLDNLETASIAGLPAGRLNVPSVGRRCRLFLNVGLVLGAYTTACAPRLVTSNTAPASATSTRHGPVNEWTILFRQGLGESPNVRLYRMTIQPDGHAFVQDDACKVSAETRLPVSEIEQLEEKVDRADLSRLKASYLPSGESDDVGAPRLTLTVIDPQRPAVVIDFDVRHAPAPLLEIEAALRAIANRLAPTCQAHPSVTR